MKEKIKMFRNYVGDDSSTKLRELENIINEWIVKNDVNITRFIQYGDCYITTCIFYTENNV